MYCFSVDRPYTLSRGDNQNFFLRGNKMNNQLPCQNAWNERKNLHVEAEKLYAEGEKLHAEGEKLHAEGYKVCPEVYRSQNNGSNVLDYKLSAEHNKLYAEAYRRHAKGNRLYAKGKESHAEGYKLYAEGNFIFYNAVIQHYGEDVNIEWLTNTVCQVNGDIYN
jgi:hypothetical protein